MNRPRQRVRHARARAHAHNFGIIRLHVRTGDDIYASNKRRRKAFDRLKTFCRKMLANKVSSLLLLCLLCCLVGVYSQTPYVSFMGLNLANHSYVDLSLVGSSDSSSVQCITDQQRCCSSAQGIHRGDWYFPNGSVLQFSGDNFNTYESRGPQRVSLLRLDANLTGSGIYCCSISTNAVHDDTDILIRDVVYVGLYRSDQGKPTSPQFPLPFIICIYIFLRNDFIVRDYKT